MNLHDWACDLQDKEIDCGESFVYHGIESFEISLDESVAWTIILVSDKRIEITSYDYRFYNTCSVCVATRHDERSVNMKRHG